MPVPSPPTTPPVAARLGWVSFLNDASGEVLTRALPLVLTGTLGAPAAVVGFIEGLAEGAAILLKGFSGWLSDRLPSRKPLVVLGYALSVAARALYLGPLTPALAGLARVADRIGKGLRGAPRDAMVADAAAAGRAGRDFGLTRFLDTLGAMAGITLVLLLGGGEGLGPRDFHRLAWIALPLGLGAVALLLLAVPPVPRATTVPLRLGFAVPARARSYLGIVLLFALANSSDAFLVLKAREAGLGFPAILLLFLAFNGLAALLAVPAGRLSDRFGRVRFLAAGWCVYAVAYAVMGTASGGTAFALALLGYGAFYGLTEGVEKALLSDLLPAGERGAGFGAFQSAHALGALAASPLMGLFMTRFGSRAAFLAAAATALAAALLLVLWRVRRPAAPGGSVIHG